MSAGLVVLAAGGTGGHMFPAEALARELVRRGRRVALVTDRRGKAFPIDSITTYRVSAGTGGRSIATKLKAAFDVARGTLSANLLLRRLAPRAVVGFGGYPSFPTMLAAARLRLPTVIHEQNAVLGRANRLLAPRMRRIASAFDSIAGLDRAATEKLVRTGNPVRPPIVAVRAHRYRPPDTNGELRLLITGGSQGARILSTVVPAALAALPDELRGRLGVSHQVRVEDIDRVRAAYAPSGISVEIRSFFEDLPARLDGAHLVISRSGGSTVAELTVAGRPAILVPFAAALADEQTANARALVDRGAAWLLSEAEFTPAALTDLILTLFAEPGLLAAAAGAAYALGQPGAANALADLVELIEAEGRR